MNQPAQRAVLGQSLQVRTGLTESRTAQPHFTDEKLPIDQMIERHIAGHDITARFTWGDVDAVVPLEAFECLDLNQGHMPAAAGIMRIGPDAGKISIVYQSSPCDRFDLIAILDYTGAGGRDVQRNDKALPGHEICFLWRATRALISGVCTPCLSKSQVPFSRISCANCFVPVSAAFRNPEP